MATNLAAANNNGQIMIGMGKRGPIEKASEGGWASEAVGQGNKRLEHGTAREEGKPKKGTCRHSPPSDLFACPLCRASHPFTAIASRRLYDYRSFKRDKHWEYWQYEAERL